MEEICISVAAKVAELLVDPIGWQISYAFKYQRNMEELKKQVKKLTNRRESVQNDVDEAKRQGEEIKKEVQDWLDSVDEFVKKVFKSFIDDQVKVQKLTHERESVQHSVDEAKKLGDEIEKQVRKWLNSAVVKPITDDIVKAKKLCSIGFCHNLKTRYSLSKKAVKTAKDGVDLLGEVKFGKVYNRLPPRRTNSLYIKGFEDFASRRSLSEHIMEALAATDTDLIGVYGMGGVGKTTLVQKVAQKAKENKLFDLVVTAVITETPDIKKIQDQIAKELGLEFRQENDYGRADQLHNRMKKDNKILVILDNVWKKLDLVSIGIPTVDDEKGSIRQKVDPEEGENANKRQCKIVFTSRNLDVLRDMGTQENFKVENLCNTEGKSLFWKTVGCLEEKSDLNPIAVEIVGKCGGLPVAIKTIANALKNKSLPYWKTARDQLKKDNPKTIRGMNEDVYSTIELSFNFLEGEEAKSLFLLCSLCNDGYSVHIHDLLNYGMGLRLFPDVDTLEQGWNMLHSLIDDLKNSCMLMDDDYDSNCVKIHDVIHAVALSISSTTKLWFNLQDDAAGLERLEKKLSKDSVAVSLPYRDIYELPEKMEFPKLELFLLYSKHASLQIPDTVFEGMKGLKVLDISGVHLMSPPSSLRCLINLHTLCLDRCRLKDVAIICELKELEILSLLNSDIEQLPREIVQLTRLRSLDLSKCLELKIIKPNVISSLTRLEELYMRDSFDQWDIEGQRNASLAELKQLSNLTALDINVPNAKIIPEGLSFEKLERYRIFVGEVWDWSGKYETSRMLKLSSSIYLSNEIKSLLNRTEDVHLDKLKGVKNVVYELNGEGFPQLKHLHVQNGSEIQHIANLFGCGLCNVFPRLESLFLDNLINLEKICHGPLATNSFSKLRIMKVRKCDRLKHLFSFSMVNNLLQLQEIEVTNCKKLEEIISKENMELVHQNESIRRIEFTQLHTLTLECLPQLTSFSFNASTPDIGSQEIVAEDEADGFMSLFSQNVVLPSLKNLKLSSVNIRCTWLDQLPVISSCCQALTNLTLQECNDLKFLFSHSVVKSLVQLQNLEIWNCKLIEGIINTEELRGDEKMIMMVFPKLLNLQLRGLPELARFGSGNSIEFLSLTQISIEDCPKLKTFFSGSKYVNIKQSKEIEEMNCHDDIHHLFNEKVRFCDIENFTVSDFSHLKEVWNEKILVSNLKSLVVDDKCCRLRYIFTSSAAFGLMQLQKLEIKNCAILEVIAVIEEETVTNNLFPNLNELKLINLPELESFCNFAGNAIELPSLTYLLIENCPNMQTFISNFTGEDMSTTKDKRLTDIQPLFDEKIRLSNLKLLRLDKMDKLREIWHHQLSSNSFSKLDSLGLHNCHNVLNVFPSNMFGRLQKLKLTVIKNCSSLYEIFELQASSCGKTQAITAAQLEKLVLHDLPKLKHIWDVDSQGLLTCQNLISIEVIDCGSLKSVFPASVGRNLLRLEQLWIENCCMVEEIFAKEEQVDEAVPRFPRLTFLRLAELPRLQSFYPRVHISEWPVLKKLHVWKCDRIEIFVSNVLRFQVNQGESQQEKPMEQPLLLLDKVPFNNLESLTLDWKWIEKESLHEKLPMYSSKLKVLTFVGFHNEANICVSCFLHKLPDLERLQARQGFFKEIFSFKGFGCEEKHVEAPSKLSILWLFDVFDTLHLWEENSLSGKVFQNLRILEVIKCGNLKCLVPSSASFTNLKTLKMSKCNGLLNLVAAPTAKSMMQLTKLSVSECERIEEIIIHEGDEVEDIIIFKKLSCLELQCLPSLTSFYSGNYITEFPSLEQLVVRECPNMKSFSRGVLRAPRLYGLQITETAEGKGYWKGNLNTTIEHLFT